MDDEWHDRIPALDGLESDAPEIPNFVEAAKVPDGQHSPGGSSVPVFQFAGSSGSGQLSDYQQ
jgi:hypothetical protein